MFSWRPAADRLPALAARTKTRMLVIRSILFPYFYFVLLVRSVFFFVPVIPFESLIYTLGMNLARGHTMPSDNRTVTPNTQRMPVLFIPHSTGPCFFMVWNPQDTWTQMRSFLEVGAETSPVRHTATVSVAASWMT